MYETYILLIHLIIFSENWAPHLQRLDKKCLKIRKKIFLKAQVLLASLALCENFKGSLAFSVKNSKKCEGVEANSGHSICLRLDLAPWKWKVNAMVCLESAK
jgi:hypothetical protein